MTNPIPSFYKNLLGVTIRSLTPEKTILQNERFMWEQLCKTQSYDNFFLYWCDLYQQLMPNKIFDYIIIGRWEV